MKDSWTWVNELVQNAIAVAVISVWLLLNVLQATEQWVEVPMSIDIAAAAVLVFYGYKVIKNGKEQP